MLVATIALTVFVTFNDMPSQPRKYNIPAEEVNASLYEFIMTTQTYNWLWFDQHEYITTRAIHGIFMPCDALRQMLDGASVEIVNPDTNVVLCPLPVPRKPHPRRIDKAPIIDPPIQRRCDCLEISGIPIPWCENEEQRLINAHRCTQ